MFKEDLNEETKLKDLRFDTIKKLCICNEDTSFYLYDLIMNLLGRGSGTNFYNLTGPLRLRVIDIYLFVLDRIRFEGMKRLGWIISYPGEEVPLVDLVLKYDEIHPFLTKVVPIISESHNSYQEYMKASDYDREWIVRKLIPEMIRTFNKEE